MKTISIVLLVMLVAALLAGNVFAMQEGLQVGSGEIEGPQYGPGPAPCSGDGYPDGPGWDEECGNLR